MTDGASIAFYMLLLILPISALVTRRLPISSVVKMVLAWLAIFAVAFASVSLWRGNFGTAPVKAPPADHTRI